MKLIRTNEFLLSFFPWNVSTDKKLQISPEGIDEMKANRDKIEWQVVRDEERRLKHDVMAHNHAFGKVGFFLEFKKENGPHL